MPWWTWLIVGTLLFATELMIVEFQFYLMSVGIAAIVVGIIDLTGIAWQPWAELLTFAVLASLSIYLVRRQILHRASQ